MDRYINNFVQCVGTCLKTLGGMTKDMTQVHWALIAVVVIGTGVVFLRGKPVQGS